MRENWWYNMGRSASDLAYTVRSGARIQVNASDYSTSDLAYVASQGNGFIVIDDARANEAPEDVDTETG
jgi:hypothetical protein